jgi:hypothetical protein
MPKQRGHFLPPLVLAMLIADDARRNPRTGKFCIHGTFDVLSAPTFPFQHPVIVVYLSLIGGHGTVPVTLRLQDADETREPIFAVDNAICFRDPTSWVELAFEFHGAVFPEPGDYRLQFCAGAELLRELRLKVRAVT